MWFYIKYINIFIRYMLESVTDLPLCLCVLKHMAPLARGAHLPAKKK